MYRPALVGLAALSLAACTTVDARIADASAHLVKACQGAQIAHATFLGISAVRPLPASVVRIHDQAWAAAGPICADPTSIRDVPSALARVGDAWAAMVEAAEQADGA